MQNEYNEILVQKVSRVCQEVCVNLLIKPYSV